ncbi:MAG: nucleotidyltransferase domain-containing protein [Thermocrispum sp.]
MGRLVRPPAEITDAIRDLIQRLLGERVEAVFVYGSVAAGAATPHSDIDTFVISRVELPHQAAVEFRAECIRLQVELGYKPDLEYPVEIFSVRGCVDALHEVLTLRALTTAARGEVLDAMTHSSDCLEVLRALLYPRLVVIDSPVLDSLTRLAAGRVDRTARTHGVGPDALRTRIGVKWLTAV